MAVPLNNSRPLFYRTRLAKSPSIVVDSVRLATTMVGNVRRFDLKVPEADGFVTVRLSLFSCNCC